VSDNLTYNVALNPAALKVCSMHQGIRYSLI